VLIRVFFEKKNHRLIPGNTQCGVRNRGTDVLVGVFYNVLYSRVNHPISSIQFYKKNVDRTHMIVSLSGARGCFR
jgi:hypothetical protein